MNEQLRRSVLQLMDHYGIGEFVYSGPDGALRISDDEPAGVHPPVLAEAAGLFFAQHPAEACIPQWPRQVHAGEIIAYLRIGPLLKPVYAAADGMLQKPQLEEGSLAGYQTRIF